MGLSSVNVKTYLADTKMENRLNSRGQSQNYLGLNLGVPYKAERWLTSTHWDAPEHYFYCNEWRRQLTFKERPSNAKQTPQGLSEAGFFYGIKPLC